MRANLVGHPGAPALANVERLKTPTVDALLQAIVGRAIHAHRATRGRDVAQFLGQREQPQAESDEYVMLCHRLSLPTGFAAGRLSRRADGPAQLGGAV